MHHDRLALPQIALLAAYALGMAGGQLLFKAAAARYVATAPLPERLLGLLGDGYFVAAVGAYALLTVLWVWILTFTPLSRGYPFVAIAFAVTPLLGALVFGEPVSGRLVLGLVLVLCGLVLVAT